MGGKGRQEGGGRGEGHRRQKKKKVIGKKTTCTKSVFTNQPLANTSSTTTTQTIRGRGGSQRVTPDKLLSGGRGGTGGDSEALSSVKASAYG